MFSLKKHQGGGLKASFLNVNTGSQFFCVRKKSSSDGAVVNVPGRFAQREVLHLASRKTVLMGWLPPPNYQFVAFHLLASSSRAILPAGGRVCACLGRLLHALFAKDIAAAIAGPLQTIRL